MNPQARDERNRRWDEPFGKEALEQETVARILSLPAFEDVSAGDFPAWLPLEEIIANEGRLRRCRRGEVIIRQGDYGDSLFVILEGAVVGLADTATEGRVRGGAQKSQKSWSRSLAQLFARPKAPEYRVSRRKRRGRNTALAARTGELDPRVVDLDRVASQNPTFTLQPPQVFGELAALTRSPRSATVIAGEDDTLLFELRWQGLREIRNWSQLFRQRIDMLYHERGLVIRLRECPIFDHVGAGALEEIASASLFETYGTFDWMHRFKSEMGRQPGTGHIIGQEPLICGQGNYVDGLLLINSGFARVTEAVDHGVRTVRYLSRNDAFGLVEIAGALEGSGSEPLRAGLHAIGYVDVIRIPTHLVRRHVLPGLPARFLAPEESVAADGRQEEMRQGMMDFLVDHRFINGEAAMVINLDRCVGCDDCVRACATAHEGNPRFVRHGPSFQNAMVVNACMHCTDPVCLIGCPTGAIHRTEESGTVVIDDNTCIGCATCANSCPYNNIRMVDIRDRTGAFMLDQDGQGIARATKCDLCKDQLTGPACVQACPHDALVRVNIRDTKKLLGWLG